MIRINNRGAQLLCFSLSVPFVLQAQGGDNRPNIIHIMTDDHSFQTISAYGHALSQMAPTPNLDRLAEEGIIFNRGYVENSISAPSRATLLTGMYSHDHGQIRLGGGLNPDVEQFPEMIRQSGYQTAVIGKWHLPIDPKGFDYYKILHDQGDYYNPEFKTKDSDGEYVQEHGYASTLITDASLDWLDNRDRSKPFCLLLHHKTPHRNWMPDIQYLNLYDDVEFPYPDNLFDDYNGREAARTQDMNIDKDLSWSYDLKVDQLKDQDSTPWIVSDWKRALDRMTPEQLEAWNAAYDPKNEAMIDASLEGEELVKWKFQRYLKDYMRCIKSLDDQVGRVLEYIEKEGIADNTVIVYTSDQGFYMGEHGWFDKRFMYEESFRTPILMRFPSAMKRVGVESEDLVQNIDFAPTYLSIAGVEIPEYMHGRSLLEIADDGKAPKDWRKSLYYHYYDYPAVHMVRRHDGVATNRYKLIHFYGQQHQSDKHIDHWEFFDLKKDPTEMNNEYDNKRYSRIIEELKAELNEYRKELGVEEF
ncbi:MAG: sulfatase [Rikenellaceae bacterium]